MGRELVLDLLAGHRSVCWVGRGIRCVCICVNEPLKRRSHHVINAKLLSELLIRF